MMNSVLPKHYPAVPFEFVDVDTGGHLKNMEQNKKKKREQNVPKIDPQKS